jgi:translation initiation factor IF-2
LDEETFQILGEELGYKVEVVSAEDEERELFDSFGLDISTEFEEDEDDMEFRAPVSPSWVTLTTVRLAC